MALKVKKPGEGRRHPDAGKLQGILGEETARLNANVPKSFYKKVRRWALDHDTTVTQMVMEALEEYMSKRE